MDSPGSITIKLCLFKRLFQTWIAASDMSIPYAFHP